MAGKFSSIDWLCGMIANDIREVPAVTQQNKDRTGTVTFKLDGTQYWVTVAKHGMTLETLRKLVKSRCDRRKDASDGGEWAAGEHTAYEIVLDLIEALSEYAPERTKPTMWEDDSVQFPRLLAEIAAIQDNLDVVGLAASMNLDKSWIAELFERAERAWEAAKEQSKSKVVRGHPRP